MGRFIVRRLIQMLFVMFAVSVMTFFIFNVIPGGDPAVRMAGKQPAEAQIEAIRREWGFDENIFVQYATTMKKVFTGDLVSYFTQLPVGREIVKGLPRTLSLAFGAAILWMFVAICFGLYSAVKAGRFADRFLTIIALIGISMPVFWLGALASYYLGYRAGIFPNGGYAEIGQDGLWQWLHHLMLPWMVLAALFIGVYSRVLRSNVLDTINDDYVRTARAKGLAERRVVVRHGLRNALGPIATLIGLDLGVLMGGAVVTEYLFAWPGVGREVLQAILEIDIPLILGVVLFSAVVIVVVNFVVDIAYGWLDPRVRIR